MNPQDDVIAAVITPIGEGGISVIRVSGRGSIEKVNAIFKGRNSLTSVSTHTAHFGCLADNAGEIIDEVVATVYKCPHSYTAEDTVEISCHGGIFVTRKVLESILKEGIRAAEPGEFTKRAFLNGRLDLSQAEAVADIIHSRSEASHRVSIAQLQGRLSGKINELREKILRICSLVELEIDFAEEDLEIQDNASLRHALDGIIQDIDQMIESYNNGKLYRDGVITVLAGKPNVGKSSILNTLLNEDRAIVTAVPGTTRDIIEENLSIDGVLFRLRDTAGLRESTDRIEQEGIKRTIQNLKNADVILGVCEAGDHCNADEEDILNYAKDAGKTADQILIVVNKADNVDFDKKLSGKKSMIKYVFVSAKTGFGIQDLKQELLLKVSMNSDFNPERSVIVSSARQANSLRSARVYLMKAGDNISEKRGNEVIAVTLRMAADSLGEIVGLISSEEIMNNIFSRFCIGK